MAYFGDDYPSNFHLTEEKAQNCENEHKFVAPGNRFCRRIHKHLSWKKSKIKTCEKWVIDI